MHFSPLSPPLALQDQPKNGVSLTFAGCYGLPLTLHHKVWKWGERAPSESDIEDET
jgi:hypothetical protein